MPELPEVETVKRSLEQIILKREIIDINIRRDSALKNITVQEINKIKNTKFKNIRRYAKYICLELSNNNILVIHLKMTGNVLILNNTDELHKHDHIVLTLDNKQELRFRDTRCFGYIAFYHSLDEAIQQENIQELAPEPEAQEFTQEYILNKYKKYKTNIKAVLLDQKKIVSGLGNIYVDEVLFRTGVHPERETNKLTEQEIIELHKNIILIIKEAVKQGGTSFRDYVDANGKKGKYSETLYVYGRKNQKCKVCDNKIEYKKLAGRGTHYCPVCQPV